MKTLTAAALAVLACAAAAPAATQTTAFSLEPRAGLALPTGEDMDGLETGYTLSLNGLLHLTPRISAFAGYSFSRFSADLDELCQEGGCPPGDFDVSANLEGLTGGARFFFPMRQAQPYLQAGLVYQRLVVNLSDGDADVSVKMDHEVGFEVGGGVDVPLSPRLSLVPAISYTSVDDAEYVKVDAGLRIRF